MGRPLLFAVVLCAAAGTACDDARRVLDGNGPATTVSAVGTVEPNAVVEFVVDGDTIDVVIDGSEERIRLIGIDTPETKRPDTPIECFGPEATLFMQQLLPVGTSVRIERDIVNRDDYGRLLGYVYRAADGIFVNYEMMRQGYAQPLSIGPNDTYAELFADAARTRQSATTPDCGPSVPVNVTSVTDFPTAGSLAERLGHAADTKLVILSCDDLGASHASNMGVRAALHDGAATCASLMVPAPWACHAANNVGPDDDIGVHLTLNAEHSCYRWGPITHAPSLQSGEGGFPRTLTDLWEHADHDEVLRELRAQIERAMAWDIDVTHLAPHLSAITLRPEFFDVYLELAHDFQLPIRLPSTISADQAGFPFRRLALDEGVVFPDHFDHDWRAGSKSRVFDAIAALQPGVTEIHVQPAIDTPEVRAFAGDAADGWIADLALVTSDDLRTALDDAGAVMIGYRALREVMRSGSA